eukprot:s760_g15.t1
MRDLLFDEESLRSIDKQTYVVKGTPGIDKTTMLYYLLSECVSEASPFTAVLFATDDGVFVARKRAAGWRTEAFQRRSKVHQNGVGQAIGLVDVAPDGKDLKAKESELDQNCGLTVPRLAVLYLQGKFEANLQKFIRSMAGRNFAGEEVSHKDAHTMVDGQGALKNDARKSGKSVFEQVASAESILDGLADDVKTKFEPGCH